jgi:hypothetical protein
VRDAQEGPRQRDVVAPCQVTVEPGADGEERRGLAVEPDLALGRGEDARQGQEQRRLAGSVRADDREVVAVANVMFRIAQNSVSTPSWRSIPTSDCLSVFRRVRRRL